jgi:hypothetical protein
MRSPPTRVEGEVGMDMVERCREIHRLADEVTLEAAELRGPLVNDVWDALPGALLIIGIPRWWRATRRLETASTALRAKAARLTAMAAPVAKFAALQDKTGG